eukprot:SM000307S11698  [mRNA]  locus=s307:5682:11674:- [translate_table: standard]
MAVAVRLLSRPAGAARRSSASPGSTLSVTPAGSVSVEEHRRAAYRRWTWPAHRCETEARDDAEQRVGAGGRNQAHARRLDGLQGLATTINAAYEQAPGRHTDQPMQLSNDKPVARADEHPARSDGSAEIGPHDHMVEDSSSFDNGGTGGGGDDGGEHHDGGGHDNGPATVEEKMLMSTESDDEEGISEDVSIEQATGTTWEQSAVEGGAALERSQAPPVFASLSSPRSSAPSSTEDSKAAATGSISHQSSNDEEGVSEADSGKGPAQDGGSAQTSDSNDEAAGIIATLKRWTARLMEVVSGTAKKKDEAGGPRVLPSSRRETEREALLAETASMVVDMLEQQEGDGALAHRSEVSALRRLQREAFADLLKARERLDKLEHHTGLRRLKGSAESQGGPRTRLKGEVTAGAAYVHVDPSAGDMARSALEQLDRAGMKTGLHVRFKFETPFRKHDSLSTQFIAGYEDPSGSHLTGSPLRLEKVMYTTELSEEVTVKAAPIGANGKDMIENINPLQLLGIGNDGLCQTGNEDGPVCSSTLAQLTLQPMDRLLLSFSAVSQFWPAPPPLGAIGMHWSEMGPLIIPKLRPLATMTRFFQPRYSTEQHTDGDGAPGVPQFNEGHELPGTSMQSVAMAGALDVGAAATLACWAQAERGLWSSERTHKGLEWNLSLLRTPDGSQSTGWGIAIGSGNSDMWSTENDDSENAHTLLQGIQAEAFLQLGVGRGCNLQPGLLYVTDRSSRNRLREALGHGVERGLLTSRMIENREQVQTKLSLQYASNLMCFRSPAMYCEASPMAWAFVNLHLSVACRMFSGGSRGPA